MKQQQQQPQCLSLSQNKCKKMQKNFNKQSNNKNATKKAPDLFKFVNLLNNKNDHPCPCPPC